MVIAKKQNGIPCFICTFLYYTADKHAILSHMSIHCISWKLPFTFDKYDMLQ